MTNLKEERRRKKQEIKQDKFGLFEKLKNKKQSFQEQENLGNENTEYSTKKKNPNREILLVTYIFVGLFVLLMGNFTYFLVVDSSEVINNSYNKRQDLLAKSVVRGEIRGSKGEVLANTVEDKEGNSKRIYPYKNMFVHIVGRFEKGRTGIESSENFKLLTSHANPFTMVMNELAGEKNIGDNVVTTLDVNLQKTAYDALGNRKGAIVVMEPRTGKILAMVSKPDYDPNKIQSNWKSLTKDSDKNSALINRATQGLYPPGSTFKILTALEYMKENPKTYKKYSYHCEGKAVFNNVLINCYNNKKHGEQDLADAFANSCNAAFAHMGTQINMNSFRKLCETFLFNFPLPTNVPYKQSSFVLDGHSDKSQIPQTVIGQGKTQISPFHSALITAAIANGGTLMNPYVIDYIENYNGDMVKKNVPSTYAKLMTTQEAEQMTKLMTEVVKNGTGYGLSGVGYSTAGKTGSAEYDSGKSSHAWFVGFAPVDTPEIAVSIIVEGAGTGSDYAVPIAKQIFNSYMNAK